MSMKIYLIFITILLVGMPYTIAKNLSQINSIGIHMLQDNNSCSEKSPNNTSTQCNSSMTYAVPNFLYISSDLKLQLSLIIFFIYFITLCLGVKTPIYKPPKYFSNHG